MNEKTGIPKGDAWRRALILETVRAALLEEYEKDLCGSEEEAMLLAFWRLLNPFGAPGREKTEIPYTASDEPGEEEPDLPPTPPRIRWLTAHVHPNEPLTPSVDDLLVYDRMDLERGACSHYIQDGLKIKKIR